MAEVIIPGSRNRSGDSELIAIVRKLYADTNQFPDIKTLKSVKSSLGNRVNLAGGLNIVFEVSLGISPRIKILQAIVKLTPPKCDYASTNEVRNYLQKLGTNISVSGIHKHLRDAMDAGFLKSSRIGKTILWQTTPAGRSFLKEKNQWPR